jgi:hypothetical protein
MASRASAEVRYLDFIRAGVGRSQLHILPPHHMFGERQPDEQVLPPSSRQSLLPPLPRCR